MSDDFLAFSPTMYDRIFTCVETKAILEFRVRLVPLNMLKLSSISFTDRFNAVQLLSIVFLIYILCLSS